MLAAGLILLLGGDITSWARYELSLVHIVSIAKHRKPNLTENIRITESPKDQEEKLLVLDSRQSLLCKGADIERFVSRSSWWQHPSLLIFWREELFRISDREFRRELLYELLIWTNEASPRQAAGYPTALAEYLQNSRSCWVCNWVYSCCRPWEAMYRWISPSLP